MSQNHWLKIAIIAKLLNLIKMCCLYQDCVETYIIHVSKNFLSYLTISLHRKEKPTQKTMYLQYTTYNKDHFSGDIVFLYKGQGQITDRYVASEYAISKSLCLCGNMLLRS